jgi:hypothetical protein
MDVLSLAAVRPSRFTVETAPAWIKAGTRSLSRRAMAAHSGEFFGAAT